MEPIYYSIKEIISWGLNNDFVRYTAQVILMLLTYFFIGYIYRKAAKKIFYIITENRKSKFTDLLLKNNFLKYSSNFLTWASIEVLVSQFFDENIVKDILEKGLSLIVFVLILMIIRVFLKTIHLYIKDMPRYKDKPIDSLFQIFKIILWLIGGIIIVSILFDKSTIDILTTLGAVSAVIILVFRDTILGFVASIQLSTNDLVRIDDWITIDEFGANGIVKEINLVTVKVINFDNTITTIPTYNLVSGSFKNWRGMKESGGRRVKRSIYIKQKSIKFLDKKDIEKYSNIQKIASYVKETQLEIDEYNTKFDLHNELCKVNGRNQTNLGVFRKYCTLYLENHKEVNKELYIMAKYLDTTINGIPLELYFFSSNKQWVNYEDIVANIFEHILAIVPYFDLEISEIELPEKIKN